MWARLVRGTTFALMAAVGACDDSTTDADSNSDGGGGGGSMVEASRGGRVGVAGTAGRGGPAGNTGTDPDATVTGRSEDPLDTHVQSPVRVIMHPSASVVGEGPTLVSFGLPFPFGALERAEDVAVFHGGVEVPAYVEATVRWRTFENQNEDSVRSVVIWLEQTFSNGDPLDIDIAFGKARTENLVLESEDVKSTWVSIGDGPSPDEYPSEARVMEPAVYATLPAAWLSASVLRTRTVPFGAGPPALAFFDEAFPAFASTAVNDVSSLVSVDSLIDYVGSAEPWLFDRALALWGVYVRSGDVEWLRHAHRAAQFYATHVNDDGYFDLADGDLKYAYGGALLLDVMLTGDTSLIPAIERVAEAGTAWNPRYTADTNFWTERHQAYALLSALSAWEATGNSEHAARAESIASTTFAMAREPEGDWDAEGCVLHTMASHEGTSEPAPICSPWMSALLSEAVYRYYLHSRDEEALEFLHGLGRAVVQHALYDGTEGDLAGQRLPYYLASSEHHYSDGGEWADVEHTCDVAGLVARAGWAAKQRGTDPSAFHTETDRLLAACKWNLSYWHREGSDTSGGLAPWRLAPPRKFNWWFGTTLDLPWLLSLR